MIKVNGIELQVEAKPKLIFMANDPDNKGRSSKTYSVVIANNQHNNEALSGVFSQGYFRTIRFAAVYTVSGIEMLGSLLINQITKHSARGVFVTGSGNLWLDLEAKNLRDFDWDAYDVVLTLANVQASETGGDIIFDLTDRGLFDADTISPTSKIDITERYPAVKLSEIFREIFNQQAVGLSWHGRQSVIDAIKDKYYLLYTQDRDFRNDDDWVVETNIAGETEETNEGNTWDTDDIHTWKTKIKIDTDNDNYNPATRAITATERGTYSLYWDYDIGLSSSGNIADMKASALGDPYTANLILTVEVNDVAIKKREEVIDFSGGSVSIDGFFDVRPTEFGANDVFTLCVELNFVYEGAPDTVGLSYDAAAKTFVFAAYRRYGANSTVKLSEVLPDMDSLAFLSACFDALNLNVYYNDETKQVELHTEPLNRQDYEIEVFEYSEDVNETENILLGFDNDKVRPPERPLMEFPGASITKTVELKFAQTFYSHCFRIFRDFTTFIPVLWESEDPTKTIYGIGYEIPENKTEANLRIVEFIKQETGLEYQQTYGGVFDTSEATATTAPLFQEPDYETLHRWQYLGEPVTITARARLNAAQVQGLYFQDYFKAPVVLKNKHGEATMVWLETATQIDGDIYELKGRRG